VFQVILVMILLFLVAFCVSQWQRPQSSIPADSATVSVEQPRVTRLFGPVANELWEIAKSHKEKTIKLVNIFCATLIGFAGALAFYAGVYFGFINPESRTDITKYIVSSRAVAVFAVLGGVVAGVFQWAQADTLAPIQAFVLGATWPSVVTRIMSGSPAPPAKPTPTDLVSGSASAGGQPSKAEVVIPPPTKG